MNVDEKYRALDFLGLCMLYFTHSQAALLHSMKMINVAGVCGMIIRLNKATRFLCICAMLTVTALISIGTRGMTVSAPYQVRTNTVPVIVYRAEAVSLRELQEDLEYLASGGYVVISEPELVAALRRERELPEKTVVLLFDDSCEVFERTVRPLLAEQELPWFSLEKSAVLTRELRTAGHPVARFERGSVFTLEEQMRVR